MKIVDFLRPELILATLGAETKSGILAEMAQHMARQLPGVDAAELERVLEEREQLASTAIGDGVAIPHGKLDAVGQIVGCLGRKANGVEFESIDGKPTYLIFMLVAPASSTGVHLKALARLSRLFREPAFRRRLIEAPDGPTMYRAIEEEDAKY